MVQSVAVSSAFDVRVTDMGLNPSSVSDWDLVYRRKGATSNLGTKTAASDSNAAGWVEFQFAATDITTAGLYELQLYANVAGRNFSHAKTMILKVTDVPPATA